MEPTPYSIIKKLEKTGREIIIKKEPADTDALAEAFARAITGGDYAGYVRKLQLQK